MGLVTLARVFVGNKWSQYQAGTDVEKGRRHHWNSETIHEFQHSIGPRPSLPPKAPILPALPHSTEITSMTEQRKQKKSNIEKTETAIETHTEALQTDSRKSRHLVYLPQTNGMPMWKSALYRALALSKRSEIEITFT